MHSIKLFRTLAGKCRTSFLPLHEQFPSCLLNHLPCSQLTLTETGNGKEPQSRMSELPVGDCGSVGRSNASYKTLLAGQSHLLLPTDSGLTGSRPGSFLTRIRLLSWISSSNSCAVFAGTTDNFLSGDSMPISPWMDAMQ